MNVSRLVYFFVLLLSAGVLPLSCGIPQFSPLPATPSLQVTGTSSILISLEPTTNEYTQGIIILYKIYQAGGLDSEYASLTGYSLGSQAYDAFVQAGYAVVVNGNNGTADIPSVVLNDFPTLFDDTALEAGFTSDSLNNIQLSYSGTSFSVDIHEGGVSQANWLLKRNGDIISSIDHNFTNVLADYPTGDSDVGNDYSGPLSIAIAVFGYRSSFGEGVQYSLPALVTPTEVYNIN